MAHQVKWTKTVLEAFIEAAMLSEDEEFIMRTRCKGWTVTKQAMTLHKSEATVHRMIRTLKDKYDIVQAENPEVFPIRRDSDVEIYMDSH